MIAIGIHDHGSCRGRVDGIIGVLAAGLTWPSGNRPLSAYHGTISQYVTVGVDSRNNMFKFAREVEGVHLITVLECNVVSL